MIKISDSFVKRSSYIPHRKQVMPQNGWNSFFSPLAMGEGGNIIN
jgi:hypothetical protein